MCGGIGHDHGMYGGEHAARVRARHARARVYPPACYTRTLYLPCMGSYLPWTCTLCTCSLRLLARSMSAQPAARLLPSSAVVLPTGCEPRLRDPTVGCAIAPTQYTFATGAFLAPDVSSEAAQPQVIVEFGLQGQKFSGTFFDAGVSAMPSGVVKSSSAAADLPLAAASAPSFQSPVQIKATTRRASSPRLPVSASTSQHARRDSQR